MSASKQRVIKYLLVLMTLLFLLFFISSIDLNEMNSMFKQTPIYIFVIMLFLQVVTMALISFQYAKIFKSYQMKIAFSKLISMQAIGTFYDSVTPMFKVGGEAFKMIYLKKQGYDTSRAAVIVLTQKIFSFFTFSLLFFFVLFYSSRRLYVFIKGHHLWLYYGFFMLLLIVLPLTFWILIKKYKPIFYGQIKKVFKSFNFHHLLIHLALGVAIWLLFAFKTYFFIRIIGLAIQVDEAMLVTYSTYMIGLLPISIAGIGTSEVSMGTMLQFFGLHEQVAYYIAIVLRFTTFWFVFLTSAIILLIQALRQASIRRYIHG